MYNLLLNSGSYSIDTRKDVGGENMVWDIVQIFLGAIIGLLLTEPYRIPSYFFLSSKTQLKGKWICAWQSDAQDSNCWSYDEVTINKRLGKMNIRVIKSSMEFDWQANLIHRGNYFVGNWESQKPDSSAHGSLMLKLSLQGNHLVGFWVGPTENKIMSGQVIIARDEIEIKNIKGSFSDYL